MAAARGAASSRDDRLVPADFVVDKTNETVVVEDMSEIVRACEHA